MRTEHPRRKFGILGIIVVVGLVTTACNPVFGTAAGPIRHGTLYSDSGQQYRYTGDGDTVTATAPSAADPSIREAFWRTDTPNYADQQSCITWHENSLSQGGDPIQPGLAMRIAPTGANGAGIKAITVTENVMYYGVWIFNVHVWDSTSTTNPFTLVGQFDLSDTTVMWTDDANGDPQGSLVPPPWHICARTQASQFAFKVWTGDNAEPGWDDPTHVFTTTLPEGWVYPGYSGGYIGHLHSGQSATFTGFSTLPLCLEPDMSEDAYCQAKIAG
ncbi:MAG TPA: hypothetical protein VFN21_04515 [Acidimicrobiales bacterium]|nr:hypothetical protein [Acidimicrobiales bacterium]